MELPENPNHQRNDGGEGGRGLLREIWEDFRPHKGKLMGAFLGLLVGWTCIRYGVIRGLFVAVCVVVGLIVGNHIDKHGDLTDILERFLR